MDQDLKVFNLVIDEPLKDRNQKALDLASDLTENLDGHFLWIDLANDEDDFMEQVPESEISYTFMKGKEDQVADLVEMMQDDEFNGFFINAADDTDDGLIREWNDLFRELSNNTGLSFFLVLNKPYQELGA